MSPQSPQSEMVGVDSHRKHLAYVLVTPARNEDAYIEQTIKSVVAQTVRPTKWVIVSDGSTDQTDSIVARYSVQHSWIELVRLQNRGGRSFASKAHAFNAGCEMLGHLTFDLIGNLDADVSFEPDYFEYLLDRFAENPGLGVGGTPFREGSFQYDYRFTSIEHVAGPCQLFRRECFAAIGGYTPAKGGGIDVIAVLTARMRGWQTRTFTGRYYIHHRQMGTAKAGGVVARYRDGMKDYSLGSHPLWELFRATYQMTKKPYVVGGCVLLSGYICSLVRGRERAASAELVQFRRKDQMRRLGALLTRLPRLGKSGALGGDAPGAAAPGPRN